MKWTDRSWILVIPCLLLFPILCFANPVVPIPFKLNIPDFKVFLSLFISVLLVESLVLKCFMWDYSYLRHLRLVFYPNIISSAVGSALFEIWNFDYFSYHWSLYWNVGLMSFVQRFLFPWVFYLFLAVGVEFPVVRYLYSKKISISQALLISFVMNLASYSLLLIIIAVYS